MEKIKSILLNGWGTLKGILLLEWTDFKNWKNFTSLRVLYLLLGILLIWGNLTSMDDNTLQWLLPVWLLASAFFKWCPILAILNRLGFKDVEL
jgi:uncharacterized membrane protein HdeD (DUF308 family)